MRNQWKLMGNLRKVIHTGNLLVCSHHILRKDVRILHVGAHAGQERNLYGEFGIKDVYWVEPLPHLVEELKTIFTPDKVIPYAVWSQKKSLKLHISKNEVSSSFYEFASTNPFKGLETISELEVPTITLDEIVEDILPSDYKPLIIVLDIQGSEYEALSGLSKKNTNKILALVVEISETPVYEGAAAARQVRQTLSALGFHRTVSLVRPPTNHGDELFLRRKELLNLAILSRAMMTHLSIKFSLFRYQIRQKKIKNETPID